MANTCQQLIAAGISRLLGQTDSPELDAELLLSKAVGQSRAWLMAYQDEFVSEADTEEFNALLQRRANGEPIAYIFGEREFWSLPFVVNDSVLIPRPDTEVLVEAVLEHCSIRLAPSETTGEHATNTLQLLDLGTGSGAIAIALASELQKLASLDFSVTAIDQSQQALEVAQINAEKNAVKNNIRFHHGSWFTPVIGKRFDIIASNPPYIAENDHHLQQGDVRFEPKAALASGIDGLQDIHHISKHVPNFLNNNGVLFLEHGFQQGKSVQAILKACGFNDIQTINDYSGNPRVTVGVWQNDLTTSASPTS